MLVTQLLLTDLSCSLIELLRFLIARTFLEIGRCLMEQTRCFFTNDLKLLDELCGSQCLREQTLTLRPGTVLYRWKRRVDRQQRPLGPLPLHGGIQALLEDDLH